jgi:tetratricopeptide (TPR) repeat protein
MTTPPAAGTEIRDSLSRLEILEERRRFADARALLAEVLPRHPAHPELLFHVAYIEYLTDNYAAAETAVQALLAMDPEHVGGRDVLQGIYAETKRPAEAEQVLIGLLRDYPEEPRFFARYSMLMLKNLQAEKAEKLAAEALRLDPDHHSAQLAMTTARLITGKADTAQHDLARLVKNHPESMAWSSPAWPTRAETGRRWPSPRKWCAPTRTNRPTWTSWFNSASPPTGPCCPCGPWFGSAGPARRLSGCWASS